MSGIYQVYTIIINRDFLAGGFPDESEMIMIEGTKRRYRMGIMIRLAGGDIEVFDIECCVRYRT